MPVPLSESVLKVAFHGARVGKAEVSNNDLFKLYNSVRNALAYCLTWVHGKWHYTLEDTSRMGKVEDGADKSEAKNVSYTSAAEQYSLCAVTREMNSQPCRQMKIIHRVAYALESDARALASVLITHWGSTVRPGLYRFV